VLDTLLFKVHENTGIWPSFQTGCIAEKASHNLKRKRLSSRLHRWLNLTGSTDSNRYRRLLTEDAQLTATNRKLQEATSQLEKANIRVLKATGCDANEFQVPHPITGSSREVQRASTARDKALKLVNRAVDHSATLTKRGTGKVSILLPHGHPDTSN
jgi:hypothetical protein